jgi:hypothetical protein
MKTLIIVATLLALNCSGQQITWQKYYSIGLYYSGCGKIWENPDSGFTVFAKKSPGPKPYHFFETDKLGDTLFLKKFDVLGAPIKTSDSGYAFTNMAILGSTTATSLMKLNSNFDTIWTQLYPQFQSSANLTQCRDSGYILCGDHFMFRTDSLGNIVWTKYIPGGGFSIECFNGDILFYGGDGANCYIAALLTANGSVKWNKNYTCIPSGSYGFAIMDAVQLPDSNFAAVCSNYDIASPGWDFMVFDHNTGDTILTRDFPWNVTQYGQIVHSKDSNLVFSNDEHLVKMDYEGTVIWNRTLSFIPYDLIACKDGGFAAAGIEYIPISPGNYGYKSAYAKLDSLGNIYNFQSVPELAVNELRVFPNPAVNQLTINHLQLTIGKPVTVTIYDVIGKIYLQQTQTAVSNLKLDLNTLPSGMYVLQLQQADRLFTGRFVKE